MEDHLATRTAHTPPWPAEFGIRVAEVLRTPLYTNAFYLWVNAAGTAVAGFAFWALVARLYDAEAVGLGSAAVSTLVLLAMFSHLGLGLGLIRFLPESGARGPRLANAVFTTSAAAAVLLSAVFLVGVPSWVPRLGFLHEQPLYSVAFISFVVAATLSLVQTHAFLAIRKARYILIQVLFVHVGRIALLVVMAALFGAFGIVASMGIAAAFGAAVGFALLARGLAGYRPAVLVDPAAVFRLLPFSMANHIADLLLLAPSLVLPLLVVSLLGYEEGAYFYMAWFLGYLLSSVSAQLALSLFVEGSHARGGLHILSGKALAGGLALTAVGAVIFLSLGDEMLLAFGRDYAAEGTTLLRIMAFAALPAVVVNLYLGALRVMKQVCELIFIAGVVAVTTVTLSCAFLPLVGLAGAGIGYGVAQGLGLAIVLARLLTTPEGPTAQRIRWLWVTLAGRP